MKKGSHQKRVNFTSRLHPELVHSARPVAHYYELPNPGPYYSTSPAREANGSGIFERKYNVIQILRYFFDVWSGY